MTLRLASIAAASMLVLTMAGCGSDEPSQASVSWTNDVCTAYGNLDTAVKDLGNDIPPIDPANPSTILDAIDVLRSQVKQIRSNTDNLREAVGTDLPPDAVDGLAALRDETSAAVDDTRATVQSVATALTALIKSPTDSNLTALRAAVDAGKADLDTVRTELDQATTDTKSQLSKALRNASACAPYLPPEG